MLNRHRQVEYCARKSAAGAFVANRISAMTRLPSEQVMHKAFVEKDPTFDGTFFVGVKTTGIFCRPVCRAKRANRENVEFYPTAQAAVRAGVGACKRCKPLS